MARRTQARGLALTAERAPLLAALDRTLKAVERRTTIPILANVLLRAEGDTLTITGTNLDVEVSTSLTATVTEPGAITVPVETFKNIVGKLPASAVPALAYDPDSGRVIVTAGRSRFLLPALPAEEFPEMTDGTRSDPQARTVALAGSILADMIGRCHFAISNEETRFYLNGIYFHVVTLNGAPTLRMVATCGHRLARIDTTRAEGIDPAMPGVIIPRKTVEIIRTLGADAGDALVEITVSATKMRATAGATLIVSKLIDGTFPDYQRVIPTTFAREARAPTLELIEALGRVSTLSGERVRGIKLNLTEDQLAITLRNVNDGAEARDEIDVEFSGEPYEIGFNAKYLAEILAQTGGDTVRLQLGTDNRDPVVIGDKLAEGLFVLMPLRI